MLIHKFGVNGIVVLASIAAVQSAAVRVDSHQHTPDILIDDCSLVNETVSSKCLESPDAVAPIFTTSAAQIDGRAAKSFYLRIMPLGASITEGFRSSDGNGYRKWLRSQLRWKGWKVNMVGSKQNGNMADNDNEGHQGWTIDQVHNAWQSSQTMRPNLVLINAGTNDCHPQIVDVPSVGPRMKSMVDDIFRTDPGVTVILSTLVKSRDNATCVDNVSQQIRDLVKNEYKDARIGLADINSAISMSQVGPDGTHPTDDGYKLFAAVWWDAISKIEDKIQPPTDVAGLDDNAVGNGNTCEKKAGNAREPVQVQIGSGQDDGNYVHSSDSKGVITSAEIAKGSDPKSITDAIPWHMFFANIVVGDPNAPREAALDDWIRVYHNTAGKNAYWFRQNQGGGKFGPSVQFNVDMDCDLGPRYAFADFNNDGLADFFCLGQGSKVSVSLNRGGNPPRFESIGQVVPTHDGFNAEDVRIADIDGDGRADYCLVKSDGVVICSRNGGQGDKYTWQGFSTETGLRGVVFDKMQGNRNGIIFGDINGDFRDDYMYIGDNGNVHTYINNRGWGSGIVPDWRDAGVTHVGQATSGIQDRIKFGRIYGSNKLDYIYLREQDTHYEVVVWENKGSGGTKRKGDGNFYCDMRGTGSDDNVWIYQDGHAYEINYNIHSPPVWGHDIDIHLNVPGPRVGIHLADWNNDGKCDVLVQNKATGALTLYENHYVAGDTDMNFENRGVVTPASVCNQGWGVGIFDRGMRLADIDGDGRADVLCLEPNGRVTAWLNPASGGMVNVGQIKFAEGWDRADIRFADVEASGRADMIHVDKYTGAATVFKNNGRASAAGGSSFSWTNRGVLYNPIDRGETMHFVNLGGIGRADLLHVLPMTNRAFVYYNECGGKGGDDGQLSDPGLPEYNSPTPTNTPTPTTSPTPSPTCTKIIPNPGKPKMVLSDNAADPSLVYDPKTCEWYTFVTANGHGYVSAYKRPGGPGDWKKIDEPIKEVPSWVNSGSIWAPDVQRIDDDHWVMYYTTISKESSAGEGKQCIGIAVSDSVQGPFKAPTDEPFACYPRQGGSIDAHGFLDPVSNRRWVSWKIDGNSIGKDTPIMLQEMESDGVNPKNGLFNPRAILNKDSDDGPLIEAPCIVYEGGKYIMFFSSNWYFTDKYDVSYAWADSVDGTWHKAKAPDGPILQTGQFGLIGPGGASSTGEGYMVFHGIKKGTEGDQKNLWRYLYEASYTVVDGKVKIATS